MTWKTRDKRSKHKHLLDGQTGGLRLGQAHLGTRNAAPNSTTARIWTFSGSFVGGPLYLWFLAKNLVLDLTYQIPWKSAGGPWKHQLWYRDTGNVQAASYLHVTKEGSDVYGNKGYCSKIESINFIDLDLQACHWSSGGCPYQLLVAMLYVHEAGEQRRRVSRRIGSALRGDHGTSTIS